MSIYFQIKKCKVDECDNCWFCSLFRPRLPQEVFENLHFIPDPVLTASKDKY
jgi:hypothetical protein